MIKINFFIIFFFSIYSNSQPYSINFNEYLELSKKNKFQLIDVRTSDEFNINRLTNAINIDFYDSIFLKKFKKFNKEDNILLYCRSGRRSLLGAEILAKNGYKNIYDLKGGVINIDKSLLDFTPLDD
tara:strand:+ start:192 stop:572 length:381 start_codon:yes stop_codon:yes gene_type:complete